jgi:heme a synthase
MPPTTDAIRRYRLFVWAIVAFTVVVILSGDLVQATESGAGCGESWPRCDGSLIPAIGDARTAVEFTHRIVTTVLSIAFIVMVVAARTLFGRGHLVWRTALWATGILILEIMLGAALVLFGWVEDDASWGRVVADGFHVINTFMLLGAVALVAHFAAGHPGFRIKPTAPRDRYLVLAIVILITITVTGTLNSLADTLYFSDDVNVDETPIAALLVTIRGIHPAVAIGGGAAIFYLVHLATAGASGATVKLALAIQGVIALQFLVGIFNIVLLTPLETQIVHLTLADALWLLLLILSAHTLATPTQAQLHSIEEISPTS